MPKVKIPKPPSPGEERLALQLRSEKITGWVRQYKFYPNRQWHSDFAWTNPDIMLIVEVEGGVFSKGRHVRPVGFTNDCSKYNEALLLGWRVLRVTTAQVKNGQALGWIKRGLV